MRLRPILADDAEALASLHLACFGPAAWPADEIADLLTGPGGFGLAVDAEGLSGFILCRAIAGEAEVLTLAVAPARQRRGHGRALLEAAAALSGALGARALFLEVAADNPPAVALYESAAFEPAGRRRAYYAKGRASPVDALVYRRALNSGPG